MTVCANCGPNNLCNKLKVVTHLFYRRIWIDSKDVVVAALSKVNIVAAVNAVSTA